MWEQRTIEIFCRSLKDHVRPFEVLEWNSGVEIADKYAASYHNNYTLIELNERQDFLCHCTQPSTFGKILWNINWLMRRTRLKRRRVHKRIIGVTIHLCINLSVTLYATKHCHVIRVYYVSIGEIFVMVHNNVIMDGMKKIVINSNSMNVRRRSIGVKMACVYLKNIGSMASKSIYRKIIRDVSCNLRGNRFNWWTALTSNLLHKVDPNEVWKTPKG